MSSSHGRHLKIVGYGDPVRLANPDRIAGFLRGLVDALRMRLLAAPTMFDVPLEIEKLGAEPFEDEGGVTGFAVLSTSHCSIHTWPLRDGFFVADLYSCRDFDTDTVELLFSRELGARRMRISDITFSLAPPDAPIPTLDF